MDSAGRHLDGLACFKDLASLAHAEQCSSGKEMNDFFARMIMRAKAPCEPLANEHLSMATIRLPDGQ
ncbi:MAG: hypothetical protein ABJE10_07590 [bacterium]